MDKPSHTSLHIMRLTFALDTRMCINPIGSRVEIMFTTKISRYIVYGIK